MNSPLNPWRIADNEEERGLLDESYTPNRSRYRSNEQSPPRPIGFRMSEEPKRAIRHLCPRISALLCALLTLGVVIKLRTSSGTPGVPTLETVVSAPPKITVPGQCHDLGEAASQVVAWIEATRGEILHPRSCFKIQGDSTATCPVPVPLILPPGLEPATEAPARRRLISVSDVPGLSHQACEQAVNWLRQYREVFQHEVSTAAKILVDVLDGHPESDQPVLDLQVFGLPQVQMFEKFRYHPEWFGRTRISKFGGGCGFGFTVSCGGKPLLKASAGTGGGFTPEDGFSTGYGGGVQIPGEGEAPLQSVASEGSTSDLKSFYGELERAIDRIKACPEGALTMEGGGSFGGDVTVNGTKYSIGWAGESFRLGPIVQKAREAAEKSLPFESNIPDVKMPHIYSKTSHDRPSNFNL